MSVSWYTLAVFIPSYSENCVQIWPINTIIELNDESKNTTECLRTNITVCFNVQSIDTGSVPTNVLFQGN